MRVSACCVVCDVATGAFGTRAGPARSCAGEIGLDLHRVLGPLADILKRNIEQYSTYEVALQNLKVDAESDDEAAVE